MREKQGTATRGERGRGRTADMGLQAGATFGVSPGQRVALGPESVTPVCMDTGRQGSWIPGSPLARRPGPRPGAQPCTTAQQKRAAFRPPF